MTARNLRPFALLILALAVVACDKGRQPPPKTTVRIINVAPTFNTLDFRREETATRTIDFKGAIDPATPYDEDTYDFHVEGRIGNTQQRILSFEQRVVAERTYAFVLHSNSAMAGGLGNAIVEYPTLPASATDAQVVAFHAGEGLPAIDVHIAPAGTNVNGAVPWGTLSFLQALAPRRLAVGNYEITLTAAGDPNNVLLTSFPFGLGPARSSIFVITPDAGQTNEPLSVFFLQDSSGVLLDRDALGSLRVLNAATDRAPRDVAVAGQFSPPLFSSVPFAQVTDYGPAPVSSSQTLNVTPPGNPGVLELNIQIATGPASQFTVFVTGDAGVLKASLTPDDNRRLPTLAKIRFYDAAPQFANGIDFFLSPPGTGTTLSSLVFIQRLGPGEAGITVPITAGDYEILLLDASSSTVIAGPTAVTLGPGGLYSALAIDAATAGTAELVLFDDFQ